MDDVASVLCVIEQRAFIAVRVGGPAAARNTEHQPFPVLSRRRAGLLVEERHHCVSPVG